MAKDINRTTSDKPISTEKLLDTAEPPIESDKVTIGALWGLLRRLPLKTFLALLTLVATYTSTIFTFGYLIAMKDTGITLNYPFDMRISVTEKDMAKNVNGAVDYSLYKLVLVKMPFTKTEERKCYAIFREVEALNDMKVGQVESLVHKSSINEIIRDKLFGLIPTSFGDIAFAQQVSLGPHMNDNNYTQSFVSPDTVNRTYNDGCVLQFKIDANGRSIPGSYVWIVYKH